jgi:hypothetical protein
MYRRPKIIYPILGLYIDDGRDRGALGKWKSSAQLVFFQAVKNDLNNVWMTKNNPHHPCLTKKGSTTLWNEYKSSLSSTGDRKWSTTSMNVWKWSTPSINDLKKWWMFSRKVIVHDVRHSYVRIVTKIAIRLKFLFE